MDNLWRGLKSTRELGLNEELLGPFLFIWPLSENFKITAVKEHLIIRIGFQDLREITAKLLSGWEEIIRLAPPADANRLRAVLIGQRSDILIRPGNFVGLAFKKRRCNMAIIDDGVGNKKVFMTPGTAVKIFMAFLKKMPCGVDCEVALEVEVE